VLSDRDRTTLAPHLTALREARAALETARDELVAASQHLAESTVGTQWLDRHLLGAFSEDKARARRYQDAQRARKTAAAAVSAGEGRVEKLAGRLDKALDPILARTDPAYRVFRTAIRECDEALSRCKSMTRHIEAALDSIDAAAVEPRADPRRERAAAQAARRYREEAAQVRRGAPAMRRAIDSAAATLAAATGRRSAATVELRLRILKDLPDGTSRPRLTTAQRPLRDLRGQLVAATGTVNRWRSQAEDGRRAALTTAREAL
jgi:hypothetical protein